MPLITLGSSEVEDSEARRVQHVATSCREPVAHVEPEILELVEHLWQLDGDGSAGPTS